MAGLRFVILCVALSAINLNGVRAVLTEEHKQKVLAFILPHVTECSKTYPIADGAVDAVIANGKIEDLDHCFINCVLQGIGLVEANGAISESKALELAKQYLPAEDQGSVPETINKCGAATSKQGCDRATELLGCANSFINLVFGIN